MDIVQLVKRFVAGIPGQNTGLYVEPTIQIRRTMAACAKLLMTGASVAEVSAKAG